MTLPTQDIAVSAMAHNRDGSLSLVCAADGSATLFRNGEKAQRVVLAGTDHFEAAVYDNCAVALVASGGQVHGVSWHGTAMRKFSHDNTVRSDVLKFGLSSTLRRMYVARRNGYVSFQDLETDESAGATLNVGQNSIAFSWSQDERLFGVLYDDLAIRVYDVQMGRILKSGTLGTPFQPVTFAIMRMSPDQRQMAVSNSQSMTIDIWDITTGATVGKLTGHTAHMHTLQFSADSDRLFSGGYDGTIREWSLKTYSQLRLIN
ncbi:MAG: serine/threonine protein kinase with repeat [Planctomycetaceae bacterium]|nr:serine/threonine protein kinase with repeat [Planctomycetaceae bacterium]